MPATNSWTRVTTYRSVAALAGTPYYLAPEVFERRPATIQNDLYSVEILVYHLLTGGYPVTTKSTQLGIEMFRPVA